MEAIVIILIAAVVIGGLFLGKAPIDADDAQGLGRDGDSPRSKAGSAGYAAGKLVGKAKEPFVRAAEKSDARASIVKYEALAKLQALLDSGAISQSEFEAEKRKYLSR